MPDEPFDMDALLQEQERYAAPRTQKERDILKAAEALFSEQGYHNTPTAEIARQAKVTERTLFKYFPSKKDLFRRILFPILLKTLVPIQFRHMNKLFNAEYESFNAFLETLITDRIQTISRHRAQVRILVAELLGNDPLREKFARLWVENIFKSAHQAFIRLQEQGKIRGDFPPENLLRTMLFMIAGYVFLSRIVMPEEKQDLPEDLRTVIALMSHGMLGGGMPDK